MQPSLSTLQSLHHSSAPCSQTPSVYGVVLSTFRLTFLDSSSFQFILLGQLLILVFSTCLRTLHRLVLMGPATLFAFFFTSSG
jgi:hypothetical protein